ncbi:MAG: FmdB family zinc ribbon protein [Brevinematia bacterium]
MPNYDYRCEKCDNIFEVFHKMTESPEVKCPECGSNAKKMLGGGAGIIFKGSGFYKTDYCNTKSSDSSKCSSCANAN